MPMPQKLSRGFVYEGQSVPPVDMPNLPKKRGIKIDGQDVPPVEMPTNKYKRGGSVGLYANIAAKRERIKRGSGEKMRKPGDPGAPTAKAFKESAKTAKK